MMDFNTLSGVRRRWGALRAIAAPVLLSIVLSACSPVGMGDTPSALDVDAPESPRRSLETKYYGSDEDVQEAIRHFHNGAFGLAQERFQKAVEASPRDLTAWMGLAASYDRLRRFDLADRAYRKAQEIGGETASLHNNLGYSYLLRGDVVAARRHFTIAYRLDPSMAALNNNLRLLDGSRNHVKRLDSAY